MLSSSWIVVREAAQVLSVSASRVQNMIADGRLSARKATKDEIAALLSDGRIRGVTPQGILLLDATEVASLQHRPRKGGRPRKTEQQ